MDSSRLGSAEFECDKGMWRSLLLTGGSVHTAVVFTLFLILNGDFFLNIFSSLDRFGLKPVLALFAIWCISSCEGDFIFESKSKGIWFFIFPALPSRVSLSPT